MHGVCEGGERAAEVCAEVAICVLILLVCAKVEDEPHTFQLCSKCKQTRFCSPECLKVAWKPFHKKVCPVTPKLIC